MKSVDLTATLANAAWSVSNAPAYVGYLQALRNPGETQEQLLMRYISRNRDTAFGRAHGFADIRSSEEFAQRIPLADYEDLQPWVDRIANGETNVLTGEPVTRLIPTSGSTHTRKLIPYTAGLQREFNLAIGPWIFDLFRARPGLMSGSAYWSITPAIHPTETQNSKIPIGFDEDSAYLGGIRKRLVDSVMATPSWLRHIESIEAWRYITVLSLLRRRDLRLVSVWHPSFLMQLLKEMNSNWDALLDDIGNGGCRFASSIPNTVRNVAMAHFLEERGRARELSRCGPSAPERVWTNLKLISCWADCHAASAAKQLASLFPSVDMQPKGLLATEGMVTIPFDGVTPVAVRSHFFEFVDAAGIARKVSDLVVGTDYDVVMTTAGGLWRYRLRDRVRVTGLLQSTPCLQFIGKDGLISDRFGEKLSDAFVGGALHAAFKHSGLNPAFAMLAPDTDGLICRYTLYLEPPSVAGLGAIVDKELSHNPGYSYCRTLGQLGSPRIFVLSENGFHAYSSQMMKNGMKLGDIKPSALSVLEGWSSIFKGNYLVDGETLKVATQNRNG